MHWLKRHWRSLRRRFGRRNALPPLPRSSPLRRPFRWLLGGAKSPAAPPLSDRRRYWRRRDSRRLLYATPSLLAFLGVAAISAFLVGQTNAELAGWYFERSQESRLRGDHSQALAYAEAAVQKLPGDSRSLMNLARISLAGDDAARAGAIFESLAPRDALGDPLAHLELAKLLLAPTAAGVNRRQAERHLALLAGSSDATGLEASRLLGEMYALTGRPGQAVPFLRRAYGDSPDRTALVLALRQSGQFGAAAAEANFCVDWLEAKLEASPADLNARVSLAQCRCVLMEHAVAARLIDAGLVPSLAPASATLLHQRRVEIYVDWLEMIDRDPNAPTAQRLDVLEQALRAEPDDSRLLTRLIAFADPQSNGRARARRLLQEQLAAGRNPGLVQYIAGLYAWQEKDLQSARTHFELAHQASPAAPEIANNLAWVLASADPPDLERALKLANGAVERIPGLPSFCSTRGTIYIKLKRWNEAIIDFETALNGNPSDPNALHAALAEAYENVGDKTLAEAHRNIIAATKSKEKK